MLVLVIAYGLGISFMTQLPGKVTLVAHVIHTFIWLMIHYIGLGLLLKSQSENKFLVRHFMKHYHYSQGDGGTGAICEAFNSWKAIYNLTLCMTYGSCFHIHTYTSFSFKVSIPVSCIGLAGKTYLYPSDWKVGNELLRHTIGVVSFLLPNWTRANTGPFCSF